LLPDLRRWTWQSDQGLWDIQDLDEIVSVQAAGYGGGSLIYANVHLRPPKEVFEHGWPAWYTPAKDATSYPLDEYYNLVASMLDVKPIVDDANPDGRLADGIPTKAQQLKEAARQGGGFFFPPLAITYEDPPVENPGEVPRNKYGAAQNKCVSCGACCSGCPHRAKNTLDLNYLKLAEDNGAKVRTQCEVVRFSRKDGLWVVEYIDHLAAQKRRVCSEYLFLCAGAVHSTQLLARWLAHAAEEEKNLRQLRANVGIGYFPNADALGMVYETRHKQFPAWGPTITTSTVHEGSQKGSGDQGWFMLQDGGYARELDRLTGVLRASVWAGRNRYPKLGCGRIPGSGKKPPPPEEQELDDGAFLRSPVDGVLSAIADGTLQMAVPRQLSGEGQAILKELAQPMLPPIVDRTIEEAVEAKLKGSFFTRWLPAAPFKAFSYLALGDKNVLAGDALQALLEGGGPPKEVASRLLGYTDERADRRMMLLAMGRDRAVGRLAYDKEYDRLRADLDLYRLAPLYMDEELSMRDVAQSLGGELRVNPAWSFLGKPITVHSHGGCRMSEDPDEGVTTPDGQVHGVDGLYVLDGSILCSSVGVNPSPTIAAVAERNIDKFLKRHQRGRKWPTRDYEDQVEASKRWYAEATAAKWSLSPPQPGAGPTSEPVGLAFDEIMQGFWSRPDGDPALDDERYRHLENKGRPGQPVTLKLTASVRNLAAFFEACSHELKIGTPESGRSTISLRVPGTPHVQEYEVAGTLQLMVADANGVPQAGKYRYKPYGLDRTDKYEGVAVQALENLITAGNKKYTTTVKKPGAAPEQRFMDYDLHFKDDKGHGWRVRGYKRLRDTASLDAWRDATSLFLKLTREDESRHAVPALAGVVHVELRDFLKQMKSTRVVTWNKAGMIDQDPTLQDPLHTAWAVGTFGTFFFGTLQRIYLPQFNSVLGTVSRAPHKRPNSVSPT
jgi:choline dehydrogenase-like flavoprotein